MPVAAGSSPSGNPQRRLSEWSAWAILKRRQGTLLLGLSLILVNRASTLVVPLATKFLLDDVIGKSNAALLLPLTFAVLGAYLIQAVSNFAVVRVVSKSALFLISEMRCKVQEHIGRLPLAFHDSQKVGELVSRVMNDVEGLRNLVGAGLVDFFGGIVSATLAICVMFVISPTLTLVTLGAMALFALFIRSVLGRMRPLFHQRSELNAQVTGRLTESLGGIRVVKGYNGEDRESKTFAAGAAKLVENALATLHLSSNTSFWTTALTGLTGAVVTYLGGQKILTGELQTGEFIMFMILLTYMTGPVLQVVNIATQLSESLAGIARSRQILSLVLDGEDPQRIHTLKNTRGDLRFEDVEFAYQSGTTVLHKINFVARPGTVTAFVGPSGSGKSTIIGLAAGFYQPTHGRVLIDGLDLKSLELSSYRSQLGLVLQEPFLFDGTIRDNVMFSRPAATESDFREACRMARLEQVAQQFANGHDTVVGERGVRLSGGQRQRISIARAMLANPQILILDEATSNLDSESEAAIQEAIVHLMKGRTTLVIAHRLSTIRRADQILYVEDGRIVERGTHEALLMARGKYHALYRRQHDLESNLMLAPGENANPEPVPDVPAVLRTRPAPTVLEETLSGLK
ncbi:MAG: ABC transporter ATP-binding protein [Bryobacteraceae bacterium]|nr:ABC transporter ATP-binding protein [Bryobacteraceae bacterium]